MADQRRKWSTILKSRGILQSAVTLHRVAAFCLPRLRLFEIAGGLVRFHHIARFIVNANYGIMGPAAMLRISDCIPDCVWFAIPQTTEWQRIGNQIDATFIFARADFINVHR